MPQEGQEVPRPLKPAISQSVLDKLGMKSEDLSPDPNKLQERVVLFKARIAGQKDYGRFKALLAEPEKDPAGVKKVVELGGDRLFLSDLRAITDLPHKAWSKWEDSRNKNNDRAKLPEEIFVNWARGLGSAALEFDDVETAFRSFNFVIAINHAAHPEIQHDILGDKECMAQLSAAAQRDSKLGTAIAVKLQKLEDERERERKTPIRRLERLFGGSK